MKRIYLILILLTLCSGCSWQQDKTDHALKVHGLFADNMVLQRDVANKVWGWANPGSKISIKFAGKKYHSEADQSGKWLTELKPHKAGGPFELELSSGANKIILRNILVGDVFFAVGQSNMEWTVSVSKHYDENLAKADDYEQIRFLTVKNNPLAEPGDNIEGKWLVNSRSTVGAQSGVAYAFAKRIHDTIKVPVGIIHSSWGNTKIEHWMSRASLEGFEEYKEIFSDFNVPLQYWVVGVFDLPDSLYAKDLKMKLGEGSINKTVWFNGVKIFPDQPNGNIYSLNKNLLQGNNQINIRLRPSDSSLARVEAYASSMARSEIGVVLPSSAKISQWQAMTQTEQEYPTVLFNAAIAPLIPFDIKAILWYQGESNADKPEAYPKLFKSMVQDWRSRFANDKLPVFSVQLAAYKDDNLKNKLPLFRIYQSQLASEVPHHYMATAIDLGDADGDVHTKEKEEVGVRLSQLALKYLYDKNVDADNLQYQSFKREGTALRLFFSNAQGGLVLKSGASPSSFEWVMKSGLVKPARAKIDGSSVLVYLDENFANYSALRYAWSDMPQISIYNSSALPLLPFIIEFK